MKKLLVGLVLAIGWMFWYSITGVVCLEFIFTKIDQPIGKVIIALMYITGTAVNMLSNLKSIFGDDKDD